MPMVEVDEVELQQNRSLRQVASAIMANPEAKKLLEKAHKMVNPQAATPTLDQEEIVAAPVKDMAKRMAEMEKQIADDKAEREKNASISALTGKVEKAKAKLRAQGWTDEGIAGVEKLADENGIIDLEIAASHFEKLHPPSQPATPSGTGAWNFMEQVQDGEADLKKLIESKGESAPLLDKMARDALNDVRGQGRR